MCTNISYHFAILMYNLFYVHRLGVGKLRSGVINISFLFYLAYLVNPLHVIPQLLQVLDVTITNFTDDKTTFTLTCGLTRFQGGLLLLGSRVGSGLTCSASPSR